MLSVMAKQSEMPLVTVLVVFSFGETAFKRAGVEFQPHRIHRGEGGGEAKA